MADITTLTQKKVKIGLKHNWGWTQFQLEYECDEETIVQRIEQLYTYDKKVSEIGSKISANEKRYQRRQDQLKKRKGGGFIELPDEPNQAEYRDILIENNECERGDTREMLVEDIPETSANALKRLRAEEERLSKEIIKLENGHKQELDAYRRCLENIRKIMADIDQIKKTLLEKQEEFENAVKMTDKYAENMNSISAERRPKVEQLTKIRSEIDELLAVNIAVYDSGEISLLENAIEFTMDISGFEEQYTRLIDHPDCSELRVKDVKILSRLLAIASHSEGRRIILLCDRPEIEEAFIKLTSSGK